MIDHQGNNVMIGAGGKDTLDTVNDGSKGSGLSRLVGGAGEDVFLIRNRRRDRPSGGAGRDSASVDKRDDLRAIEEVLTQVRRFAGARPL